MDVDEERNSLNRASDFFIVVYSLSSEQAERASFETRFQSSAVSKFWNWSDRTSLSLLTPTERSRKLAHHGIRQAADLVGPDLTYSRSPDPVLSVIA
mmetsp:Transcript_20882/g.57491  ORF Transcript_20882/g.57491 Transcript_20882/m.57491 type:complete len:97 (+) Transcript_20882:134-424(+)